MANQIKIKPQAIALAAKVLECMKAFEGGVAIVPGHDGSLDIEYYFNNDNDFHIDGYSIEINIRPYPAKK